MNILSKSKVFVEDKLFATLNTTVRKVVVKNLPFLMSDTVGFIRKLPTQLIESFKSTLDEVREADLLIHVVDISHSNFEEHVESVDKILEEIKSSDKPTIMVFNKIDNYSFEEFDEEDLISIRDKSNYNLDDWKNTWMSNSDNEVRFISALNNENINDLKNCLYSEVRKIHITRFPYNKFLYPDC
jgi:GTP-binding protein HflX